MPWIIITIVAASVVTATTVVMLRRGSLRPTSEDDQWATIGIVFITAGIATSLTLGPGMLAMTGVGAVFLVKGLRSRSEHRR